MLMALTALKRCSDLHILDTRFMALGETKVVFKLSEKPKGLRGKGKTPEPVDFFHQGRYYAQYLELEITLKGLRHGEKLTH